MQACDRMGHSNAGLPIQLTIYIYHSRLNQYKLNDTYKPVSEATKQHSTRNESNALQNWREKMVERKKHQGYISKESFIFAFIQYVQ